MCLANLGGSSHVLMIEQGRHCGLPEYYRTCTYCEGCICIWLSDWHSGNALASYRCHPGSIPALACQMIMWTQSQTGEFPPGTPFSSHTMTIRTQTSVSTSMLNISCITCFVHTKHVYLVELFKSSDETIFKRLEVVILISR